MPEEKNRRLMLGSDIIYPITKQENIIGLQKTIKEKLPIVSDSTPAVGTYVERQVWIDTNDLANSVVHYNPIPHVNLESGVENNYSLPSNIENNFESDNRSIIENNYNLNGIEDNYSQEATIEDNFGSN